MKKILVNAYFARNLGDDLFLKILFDRYKNVEWHLLTASKSYKQIFASYNNVKIIRTLSIGPRKRKYNFFYKINDHFFKYSKYDAFVTIGGSIFMETGKWKEGLEQRKYLPALFNKMNKKTFVIGANFGPFEDKNFVEKHREFFDVFDDICFRDKYSYSIFSDLENIRVAPDVVFNLQEHSNDTKEKSVGFSLINLENRPGLKDFYHQYNSKIIQLIDLYTELGYKIKLFSFCKYEGDLKINQHIIECINKKNRSSVKLINYEGDINGFLNEFKSCEVIIGTRFHSIILAMVFNQSVYPIIYSEKTYNVLKDLNMEENCCYIKDIEQVEIQNVVGTALLNRIKDKSVFTEANKQFEKLDLFVSDLTSNEVGNFSQTVRNKPTINS